MSCTSACRTKDHKSYGACLRSQGQMVAYCGIGGGDATAQKRWDSELDLYRAARHQGVQPSGTDRASVERALTISETTGTAWQSEAGI